MEDLNPLVAEVADLLDPDLRERFVDRVAAIERHWKAPRVLAECFALLSILQTYPDALVRVSLLEFDLGGERRWILTSDIAGARERLGRDGIEWCRLGVDEAVLMAEFGGLAALAPLERLRPPSI